MTGFLILLGLASAALAMLYCRGVRGSLLTLVAAAVMVGSAGYALQGRPGLGGSPALGTAGNSHVPLARARHILIGRFTRTEHWMIISDSYAARGETADAVGLVQSGLRAHPDDFSLWVGLGNALVDHAGIMTPAAEFAYARARTLAPWSPAPPFFHGLAMLRSGDRAAALAEWKALLASASAEVGWRPLVEDGVAMLERGQAGS